MNKFDIIIFGARDWSNNWITQHRLAKTLSEKNHRVLFIENTGIRTAQIRDLPRILQRLKNWKKSIGGFRKISENLTVFSPLVLPFPYNKTINKINNIFLKMSLSNWIEKNKYNSINYITFLATPLINKYINNSNYFSKIYYCGDDHEEASNNPNFPEFEKELASTTDLNLATSQKLYERLLNFNKNTYKISAGVELNKFDISKKNLIPDDIKKITKPIVGYIGGLNEKLDTNLILKLSEERPNYSIVMIGEQDGKFENKNKLKNQKNIYFLGKKNHDQMSNYISYFDCAIIPYKINKFTDAVYPSKLNEFLSMGKPVVTTNFYEMSFFNKENNEIVSISNESNFNYLIDSCINDINNTNNESLRVGVSKKNKWENKFTKIYELLLEINNKKIISKFDWQKNFENEYLKLRKKISTFGIILTLVFSTLFISPLPYYAGTYLEVKDKPKKNLTLVALSGYGSPNYINNLYQQRALDVFYYYKKGFGNRILLSGRKQLIEEFELMKSILVGLNIPEDKIDIINEDFNSTYTNLLLVNNYMNDNNINEINLITSSYHQKRVKVLFEKISNVNKVYIVPESSNEKKSRWFFSLNQIKVIFYEYISLLYNKLKY